MRGIGFLVSLLPAITAIAQNWALLNPAYRYNYSNDGTDTISNQIRVMGVDTLGVDSFRYELNRIAVVCDNCIGTFTSLCSSAANPSVVQIGRPQVVGWSVVKYQNQWTVEGNDTLTVLPWTDQGATWTGPDGATATVLLKDTMTVLSVMDSVKWIGYSTGDTVVVSKNHGLVHVRLQGSDAHDLIGVNGSLTAGIQFPRFIDLFNYQPGDILQYLDGRGYQDSFCVWQVGGTTKYRVLERADLTDRTEYIMQAIHNESGTSFNPLNWQSCGNFQSTGVDTVILSVRHDRWDEANFFMPDWESGLWPGAVGMIYYPNEWFPGVWPSGISVTEASLDGSQRMVVDLRSFEPDWEENVLCQSVEDSTIYLPDYNLEYYCSFTHGIGLTIRHNYSFESGSSRELQGYQINGAEWGTITPDGVLLGIADNTLPNSPFIFPNPSSDHIQIALTIPGARYSIYDSRGQLVASLTLTSAKDDVDVRTLPPGAYLLVIDGFAPQRFMIVR